MNDLLLLAMLLGGPQHGYALKKAAGLITGQTDMHNNLVYPLLRRFVREGWVTQKKPPANAGKRARFIRSPRLGAVRSWRVFAISTKAPLVPAINSVCGWECFRCSMHLRARQSLKSAKPTCGGAPNVSVRWKVEWRLARMAVRWSASCVSK
jgi:hypothetical protein